MVKMKNGTIGALFAVLNIALVCASCICPDCWERESCLPCTYYSGRDPDPSEKTVFVEMQPWYGNPIEGKSSSWYHWNYNFHDPADEDYLEEHGHRDVASVYYPLIGAYDSFDTRVIDWQIDICKAMRIDCIMIDYYGDGISPESTDFQHYKEVTGKIIRQGCMKGIKVVLLYETQVRKESSNKAEDILRDLNAILDNSEWMNNKAYLHYNNVPVICVFGISELNHGEWSVIKDSISYKACLVADTQPYQYENPYFDNAAFNGCFKWELYNDEIKSEKNPAYNDVMSYAARRNNDCGWWVTQGTDRFAFSTIHPGFDDTAVDGWGNGRRVVNFSVSDYPDDDTSFYGATMDAALNPSFPINWILIATLNDWNESTSIEPSREKGYRYAIKTKQFVETLKGVPEDQQEPDNVIQEITEGYAFTFK